MGVPFVDKIFCTDIFPTPSIKAGKCASSTPRQPYGMVLLVQMQSVVTRQVTSPHVLSSLPLHVFSGYIIPGTKSYIAAFDSPAVASVEGSCVAAFRNAGSVRILSAKALAVALAMEMTSSHWLSWLRRLPSDLDSAK